MNMKPKQTAKKVITWVIGTPAALLLCGELQDLSYWWVQAVAVIAVLGLMAWWGLLKRTTYDEHGYAVER
jgi:predicted ABC-type sugar transport system permease subunit